MRNYSNELSKDDIIAMFDTRAMYFVREDGTDAMVGDNGYTLEDCLKLYEQGCSFYLDEENKQEKNFPVLENDLKIHEVYTNAIDFISASTENVYTVYIYYDNDYIHPKVGEVSNMIGEEVLLTDEEKQYLQHLVDENHFQEYQFGRELVQDIEKELDLEK